MGEVLEIQDYCGERMPGLRSPCGLEDKPEYGGTLKAALRYGFNDFA